ncbi:hypothetical protein [Leuconostoc citreum]|uniref:hypothetical protein n=1 Tax=Leuconostoc citreum TaxID=33964 RepID=UPI00209DC9C6|nr:hypothetical protein [Leuconostoc citreum]MCP1275463.1 hypothetical protein [Leuconostoc citreum]MCT3077185.1 hypothetical protein [Leuconostoc citreum]
MVTENIIQAFAIAGGFGFVNVLTLEQIGVQTFDDKSNKDRNILLFSFSAFNYLSYSFSKSLWLTVLLSIVITILAIFMFIIGFPMIRSAYNKLIGTAQVKQIMSYVKFTQSDPWDEFLKYSYNADASIYIFDYENILISGGRLQRSSNSLGSRNIALVRYEEDSPWNVSNYEELILLISKRDSIAETFVDTERKVKFISVS